MRIILALPLSARVRTRIARRNLTLKTTRYVLSKLQTPARVDTVHTVNVSLTVTTLCSTITFGLHCDNASNAISTYEYSTVASLFSACATKNPNIQPARSRGPGQNRRSQITLGIICHHFGFARFCGHAPSCPTIHECSRRKSSFIPYCGSL